MDKPRLDQGPDYERGFIDGMQKQMQSSVDKAVNAMSKCEWAGLKDEPVGWIDSKGNMICTKINESCKPLYTTPQRTWVGLTPLNIEDEYVRNYLWERALIAIDDPCCRSHPHENMNEYCQRRTELARYQAKLKEKNGY